MLRYLIPGVIAAFATTPAFAAPQYFVLVGANRQCQILEVQPLDDSAAIYEGEGYATPEAAKAATAAICSNSGASQTGKSVSKPSHKRRNEPPGHQRPSKGSEIGVNSVVYV